MDRVPTGFERDQFPALPPDLVGEVVCPMSETQEVDDDKVARYLAAGVSLVWVFTPRASSVTVHRRAKPVCTLHPGGSLDGEEIIPGFTLPFDRIF